MSERTVIAFIAVTGSPTIEDINKIMQGYKSVNINDVLVYPRDGLETEYMSEEWRSVFSIFLDFAVKNDMRVWLYDEFNWPSGTCNSQVYYENDEYYGKKIYIENGEAKVYQYGFKFDKSEWPFANCNNSLICFSLLNTILSKYYEIYWQCMFCPTKKEAYLEASFFMPNSIGFGYHSRRS